ncbi:hypothetical protein KJ765_06475 [Candidatus Micrarchaeota archaeon]|nr:hypothetical protein [Candidatus Micrarchaeota archaeon]
MDRMDGVRLLLASVLLLVFYSLGLPLQYVVIIGFMFLVLLVLRGPFYRKVDGFLVQRFAFVRRMSPWSRRILVILVFLLFYLIFKQFVYEFLKLFGIDIPGVLMELTESSNARP